MTNPCSDNYDNPSFAFCIDEFTNFRAFLELFHYNIFMKWDVDLNSGGESLMWKLDGTEVAAMHNKLTINRETFAAIAVNVKAHCTG